jgi:hypothetical protein
MNTILNTKSSIFLIGLFLFSNTCFAQILNASFEQWNQSDPTSWQSSNMASNISVYKSSNSWDGINACKIATNFKSFEGNPPSWIAQSFIMNQSTNALRLNILIDSIENLSNNPNIGARIEVYKWQNSQWIQIGDSLSSALSTAYRTMDIFFAAPLSFGDSIKIKIAASTYSTALGYNGYCSFLLDKIGFIQEQPQSIDTEKLEPVYYYIANGNLFLNTDLLGNAEVSVYSFSGALIHKSKGEKVIGLSSMANGMYFILSDRKRLGSIFLANN